MNASTLGWEIGKEYEYDYNGQVLNSINNGMITEQLPASAIQISARLTVQCIDESTLTLKVHLKTFNIYISTVASIKQIRLPVKIGRRFNSHGNTCSSKIDAFFNGFIEAFTEISF